VIGHTLGRYEILAELGRGTMGVVYKARDPIIDRHVAVKTLRTDLPPDEMPDVRERFLREARSAGRLSHPAIVVIHDVGDSDGTAYIAMELLQGESLKAVMAASRRLQLDVAAELVAQIADGLDYAQRHEIVHRDVKPANIMVTAPGTAKLTDFGIAYMPSLSGTQTDVLGSPKYMSPEQVMGEALDGRSDIFSLGVVLYEMLTRKTPFERPGDASVYRLMQRITSFPHERPSEVDPRIPRGFDVILARALAKEPARRYARAAELAADLRKLRELLLAAARQASAAVAVPAGGGAGAVAAPSAPSAPVRSGVLGMLRQKAEADATAHSGPAVAAETIDARMRAAFRYLNELGNEIKAARPACQRRFELVFLGVRLHVPVRRLPHSRGVRGRPLRADHLHRAAGGRGAGADRPGPRRDPAAEGRPRPRGVQVRVHRNEERLRRRHARPLHHRGRAARERGAARRLRVGRRPRRPAERRGLGQHEAAAPGR
jgi:hypothetical protein